GTLCYTRLGSIRGFEYRFTSREYVRIMINCLSYQLFFLIGKQQRWNDSLFGLCITAVHLPVNAKSVFYPGIAFTPGVFIQRHKDLTAFIQTVEKLLDLIRILTIDIIRN